MLLEGYTKRIFRPECNPSFQSIHCIAELDQDVGKVLPYLNAELGGFEYFRDPPAVTFRTQGKIITVYPRQIAINALKDEAEAEKILQWLKGEINQTWENREAITPCYAGKVKPKLLEVLRLLPKTNCKRCGQPTCMVFAAQIVEGGRGIEHCPELSEHHRAKLVSYLEAFEFD
jgi:ArsR family metal-binding transcriptional regulator